MVPCSFHRGHTLIFLRIPISSLFLLIKRLHRRIPNLELSILIPYHDIRRVGFGVHVQAQRLCGCGGRACGGAAAEVLMEEITAHVVCGAIA